MTLEAVYFISQAIAAVAIVASLLFVGIQVKQASLRQKREIELNREELHLGALIRLTEGEFASLWFKAATQSENLTDEEIYRIYFAISASVVSTRERFLEYKSGLLSEEHWVRSRGNLRFILTTPIFRAAFIVCRKIAHPDPQFDAEFAEALASPIRAVHLELVSQVRELAIEASGEGNSDLDKKPSARGLG